MTFVSALFLGFLGSAHCTLMCGGLQSALQQPMVIRSSKQARYHLIALNLGRISTYLFAGLILSSAGIIVIKLIDVPALARVTRLATAVVLLLVGMQLLFSNQKPFAALEVFGVSLWKHVSRYLPRTDSNQLTGSFFRGLLWGFLPCGLIYGVLLTTLFSDDSLRGALIMLGFGLGTLPAMVLTGGLYIQLRNLVRNKVLRLVGAAVFIQGAVLMVVAPWFVSTEFMNAYPELMSVVFCFTPS